MPASLGGAGSESRNKIDNKVNASIVNRANVTTAGDVALAAADQPTIAALGLLHAALYDEGVEDSETLGALTAAASQRLAGVLA